MAELNSTVVLNNLTVNNGNLDGVFCHNIIIRYKPPGQGQVSFSSSAYLTIITRSSDKILTVKQLLDSICTNQFYPIRVEEGMVVLNSAASPGILFKEGQIFKCGYHKPSSTRSALTSYDLFSDSGETYNNFSISSDFVQGVD